MVTMLTNSLPRQDLFVLVLKPVTVIGKQQYLSIKSAHHWRYGSLLHLVLKFLQPSSGQAYHFLITLMASDELGVVIGHLRRKYRMF